MGKKKWRQDFRAPNRIYGNRGWIEYDLDAIRELERRNLAEFEMQHSAERIEHEIQHAARMIEYEMLNSGTEFRRNQGKKARKQPEEPENQDWDFITRFFGGVFRGLILGMVSRLCWKYVLFTVATMGVLSYTSEISISWTRQCKQGAYRNFGLAGFSGMALGLVWGMSAGNDYLKTERDLEARLRVSEATR